jgi:hypothetical protein
VDASGIGVIAVGLVLCLFGVRSPHLAVITGGLALGWLVTEPFGPSLLTAFVVAGAAGLVAWIVAGLVFRAGLFFVGALAGSVIGAKLFGLFRGDSVILEILFVAAVAVLAGLAAQNLPRTVAGAACALGGAGLVLSGVAMLLPATASVLRHPAGAWQAVVAGVAWVALAVVGWVSQRRAAAPGPAPTRRVFGRPRPRHG